jgi:hypothetical protein
MMLPPSRKFFSAVFVAFDGTDWMKSEYAGIVHQNIEVAKRAMRRREQRIEVFLPGDVRPDSLHAGAGRFKLGGQFRRSVTIRKIVEDDVRAFFRQFPNDTGTDSLRATGSDCCFALE